MECLKREEREKEGKGKKSNGFQIVLLKKIN